MSGAEGGLECGFPESFLVTVRYVDEERTQASHEVVRGCEVDQQSQGAGEGNPEETPGGPEHQQECR